MQIKKIRRINMALNKNVAKGIKTRQENELRENNKLIAKFMGYMCDNPEEDSCTFETPFMINTSDKENWEADINDWNSWLRADEMQYHTSWDWLMPVVEKIESFVYENGCAKYNVIIEQSWVDIIDNHTSDEIVGVDADSKDIAVYKAVVEFIEWYNKKEE